MKSFAVVSNEQTIVFSPEETDQGFDLYDKLHLGCGQKYIPGFVHVDILPYDHVEKVSRVDQLEFVLDQSVSLIYACHVLEHFGRHEYQQVLKNWYQKLKPTGILRLAVPDFSACVRVYHNQGLKDGLSGLIGLVCGGQRDEYDFHKMIFDYNLLEKSLLDAGFSSVRRWDWQETEHSHIDDYSQAYLPHLDKENGTLMSLNVEAVK